MNLAYTDQVQPNNIKSEVASANYGVNLFRRRVNFSINAYEDLVTRTGGAVLTLIVPLGRHVEGQVETNQLHKGSYERVEVRGDAVNERLNWTLSAQNGPFAGGYAEAEWMGHHVDLYGKISSVGDSRGIDVEVGQSLVFLDGRAFVSNRVLDAFTVVDVPASPGVEVFLENRQVGRTNSDGLLFVNDLEPYVPNAISIDPLGLAMDAHIARTATLVAPRENAGVVTRFAVTRENGAILLLDLPNGRPPPVGAGVLLNDAKTSAVMGYDGEVYVVGSKAGANRVEVTWVGGRCAATFNFTPRKGRIQRLGPLKCALL